jgi:glycosyltransferase involved in cell wall biosynthesis
MPDTAFDSDIRTGAMRLSVVVPCYNEADNLPQLYARLRGVLDGLGIDWELILVDDHSRDQTFATALNLIANDPRVRAVRMARNVGSHLAGICGLRLAQGDAAVFIAADLQDPPELIADMLANWRKGDQIVWAVRERRIGVPWHQRWLSRKYDAVMAHILGSTVAAQGADVFLIDRLVIEALRDFRESNLTLFALLQWIGYRQGVVHYVKQARLNGRSGWTLRKKLKLLVDSITAFSYAPIRFMSVVGAVVSLVGLLYAIVVAVNYLFGRPPEGWSSLVFIVLITGGVQMTMLGILGEYLWRALDEARRRPQYHIEVDSRDLAAALRAERRAREREADRVGGTRVS